MKNYTCKVSVVIPCYNAQKFIHDAIFSILQQSFSDFEILAIDDGSTDETCTIIEDFADSRIRLVRRETNMGNCCARNVGMKLAKGEYICAMDADDTMVFNRFEKQVGLLDSFPNIGVVATNYIVIDEQGKEISRRALPSAHSQLKIILLRNNFILHSSLMFRSAINRESGYYYNEEIQYAADYDFLIRLSKKFEFACLQEYLSLYRIHSNQISKTKSHFQKETANRIREDQFKECGIYRNQDLDLLNKFMRNERHSESELIRVVDLLNTILERHKDSQSLDEEYFLHYFQKCIESTKLI